MVHTSENKNNFRTILNVTLVMTLVAIAYAVTFATLHWHSILNGIAIGATIGFVGSVTELYVFARYRRQLSFSMMVVVRSLFYVLLVGFTVFTVIAYHSMWMHALTLEQALESDDFHTFMHKGEFFRIVVFSLVVSFLINFVRQVNRLLGHNALLDFITGKYHQPISEERVFMFLDLKASTTIAEKLGDMKYHAFLNDFFHDVSPAIQESKGSIYQYVGDEVVVTWTKEKGLSDANCINCYFRVAAAIHLNAGRYEEAYGVVPEFKAGYHFGPVISGEIGDMKREIVFHGDTVNTAARIRTECTVFRKDLLLSNDLLQRLPIKSYLSPESIGKIRLRGKEEEIELFTIKEAA